MEDVKYYCFFFLLPGLNSSDLFVYGFFFFFSMLFLFPARWPQMGMECEQDISQNDECLAKIK